MLDAWNRRSVRTSLVVVLSHITTAMLMRNIDIRIPSVHLSVTFRFCIKTAYIITIIHHTLVLWVPNIFVEF